MAIEILGLKNEHRAKDVLERLLDTSNDQLLKETAALALARLGNAKGIPALETLMRASTSANRRIFMAARLAEFGNASGTGMSRRRPRETIGTFNIWLSAIWCRFFATKRF